MTEPNAPPDPLAGHERDDDDEDDFDEDDELEDEHDDPLATADDVGDVGDPKRGPGGAGFATKMFGDLAKRALMTGIGAVFMSEESLRGQLAEMKLPKEAMHYVVQQADKTKKEIVTAIARETRDFLSKLEVDKVLARALVGTTVEIQTRIRVLPKEGGGFETQVERNDMSLTPSDDKQPPAADSAPPPKGKKRRTR